MIDLNTILQILTLVLLSVGGYLIKTAKTATEAAIKTAAEETAKEVLRKINWASELKRELQKTRGIERQELRFKSYGGLWKELRPLAVYVNSIIDKKTVSELSSKLSDWYFSECGGLLLTQQARDFYFALQDLLRSTSMTIEGWKAVHSEKPEGGHKSILLSLLKEKNAKDAIDVLEYFSQGKFENWQERAIDLGEKWKKGIREIGSAWSEIDEGQRFASLQQTGSILRTTLVIDLESRQI